MKSDIEIARSIRLQPIRQISEGLGIPEDELEPARLLALGLEVVVLAVKPGIGVRRVTRIRSARTKRRHLGPSGRGKTEKNGQNGNGFDESHVEHYTILTKGCQ